MLAPNTLLQNRYLIIRSIGQGGMGAVYMARDQRLRSVVALKESFFSDERMRRAFEREAELLANLHHPALPNVIDHFAEGDGQFLVMQFIPGEDLGAMMEQRGGPFPAEEVLTWADQLLDALDYLHTQEPPILHRDIKPQNLKLTGRGQIILLDFGLAKGTAGQMTTFGASRSVLAFTPNFAPLEQIQGEGTDARSDLYALSATLYYLMTGIVPPDALMRASAIVRGQPDPLELANELSSDVSSSVARILSDALSQNPDQRPQTAEEMRKTLSLARMETRDSLPENSLPPTEIAPPAVESAPAPEAPPELEVNDQPFAESELLVVSNENAAQAPVKPQPSVPPTVASPQPSALASYEPTLQAAQLAQPADSGSTRDSVPASKPGLSPSVGERPPQRKTNLWVGMGVAALVVIGLIVAADLGLFSGSGDVTTKPGSTGSTTSNGTTPALKSFSFDTVRLDAGGKVTDKRTGQTRSYAEDLGNGVQLEMVEIPAGTFTMGSPSNEKDRGNDEGPQHQVTVPKFYMGKFEVTQAQWRAVANLPKVDGYLNPDPSNFKGDNLPVERVSWAEAIEFCKRLSKKTSREYRLPSEAEWEYAARAGTTSPFAFGETITTDIVNYNGNNLYGSAPKGAYREKTVEVGSLGVANPFGLYDMHGNVQEWCQDWLHNSYDGAPTDGSAWESGGGQSRVLRGGSWVRPALSLRSANRGGFYPYDGGYGEGFRVVAVVRT